MDYKLEVREEKIGVRRDLELFWLSPEVLWEKISCAYITFCALYSTIFVHYIAYGCHIC